MGFNFSIKSSILSFLHLILAIPSHPTSAGNAQPNAAYDSDSNDNDVHTEFNKVFTNCYNLQDELIKFDDVTDQVFKTTLYSFISYLVSPETSSLLYPY